MRITQKKKIEDLILTIRNVQLESYRFAKKQQRENAINLLADCQDGLVRIGEVIEEIEGENHKVIRDLEAYCVLLYKAALALQNNNDINEIYNKLHNTVEDIEALIHSSITETYEVVFLPYKASMWDSLESVWTAAREDPKCDSYVIPIPYYDRNPDGSFGNMHYEGGQYPSYVPITNWKTYNLQERHPDVIYIHNPYDECNLVTSVHPDFYAKRLKELTNLLVYIPYFVSIDNVAEDFCDAPGVFFADRVILESEKVKNTYMKVLRNFENKYNRKGMFGDLSKKFLVLGSPKYDKVYDISLAKVEIPPEWRRIMVDRNGKRKKVILYNTSLTSFLQNEEKELIKLNTVFDFFRSNQDIVLLWRPHPLIETTIASMRPALLEKYRSINKRYREEKWGIYDDTPDLHRAIALSDAYYGDWSSVVALYKVTGKPIMIECM